MATRRQLLIFGGGAVLWVGAFRAGPEFASRLSGFEFTPMTKVPGLWTISTTGASTSAGTGGFDFMAGLGPEPPFNAGFDAAARPAELAVRRSRKERWRPHSGAAQETID
ncbi:hypothetical protein LX81_03489 [Palleronia aestuarii]|uniref:Uncharacterized protein n=1 Tax=Palleronia aestuarii TaxID=568105 RepID=A0A2W7NNE3_9RHOB|nr:hypothetical protein [Palleronia aestuarii]PZX12782.1 hypothetical protein LX81_03489 [Palleronia aestuarii]